MTAPKEIIRLVERFPRECGRYPDLLENEAQLRLQFINDFFEALGWDVKHENPGPRQVLVENLGDDSVTPHKRHTKPDYAFLTSGSVRAKLYAEAKKASIDIENDKDSAFQARRYGWTAKHPLAILTNFKQFAFYDCSIRPHVHDSASTARLNNKVYTFEEYPEKWAEIERIFSRGAVEHGSLDRYAKAGRGKRGTSEVDAAFLDQISRWRINLAKDIDKHNRRLSPDDLSAVVQRTIDRIIFLRMCEDRGSESYEQLQQILDDEYIYSRLLKLYTKADQKYNSGLFYFEHEKDRGEPDTLTPSLKISNKVLQDIIKELYYPCPYAFSVLPVEILGNVYEQFLGEVIRLTPNEVKVDYKPEVKKAGGVYYTPEYIVDYIVENTVRKFCEGKAPKEMGKLCILDPACGSGSFLIGAYTRLLKCYRDWYVEHNPAKFNKKQLRRDAQDEWQLTISEKKRILLHNIYGVDIDPQAVEVTKLSLLLKALEGENAETLEQQTRLFHERALPDLDNNIKCGNSLIGPDYFADMLIPDTEEMKRVNPFDWKREFPEIFLTTKNTKDTKKNNLGFDCVIGNPPYIRIQKMKEWAPREVEIYKEKYAAARSGNYDIYVVFVEKGLSLLREGGRLGFILPHKFFNAQYGEPLRGLVSQGKHLAHVVHFGSNQVFVGATTYTCLLFLNKSGSDQCRVNKVANIQEWRDTGKGVEGSVQAKGITEAEWNFVVGDDARLFNKLSAMPLNLGEVADIFVGLQTSADDVFILDLVEETTHLLKLRSKSLNKEVTLEKGILYPLVSGTDVDRYGTLSERQYILFPYSVEAEQAHLIPIKTISQKWPQTTKYLLDNKVRLETRESGRFRGSDWYRFGRSQNLGIQERVKICVPRLVERLYAAYDADGKHFLDNVDVGGITLKQKHERVGLPYLLGLLNSSLLRWFFPFVSAPFRGGWWSANRQFLSKLPIRVIDFSDKAEKARHDKMVNLVERMLGLHKQVAKAKGERERTVVQRQIDSTDAEIDKLVYELYGLTDKEIAIVEGK